MKMCPKCRQLVPDDAARCPRSECGAALPGAEVPAAPSGAKRPPAPPARIAGVSTVKPAADAPPAGAEKRVPTPPVQIGGPSGVKPPSDAKVKSLRPSPPPSKIEVPAAPTPAAAQSPPSGSSPPTTMRAVSGLPRPKRPPAPLRQVNMGADSEQQRYLASLQTRVEVGRGRSRWLALAGAAVLAASAICWLWHRLAEVSAYARLAHEIRLDRNGGDPGRLIIWYCPQTGGMVGFRRAEVGRETELLDEVPSGTSDAEQKFEWRSASLRTGDAVKVTYRDGWSLATRELSVPEPSPAPPLGDAVLVGEVVNATNNKPVAGAAVKIVGTRLATTTGPDGRFRLHEAPKGPVGFEVSCGGYGTEQLEQELTSGKETPTRVVLNPGMAQGQIRAVLTWDEEPKDLDAHLEGPLPEGKKFHVYFKEKGDLKSREFVSLDVDAQRGRGPETVTVLGVLPGTYHYFVHDYTNRNYLESVALGHSGAEVRVYQGGQTYRFRANGRSQGNIWRVCDIQVTAAGATVTKIDRYESKRHQEASQVDLVMNKEKPSAYARTTAEPKVEYEPMAVAPKPRAKPRPLRLAVTPRQFDDMGRLLDQLGEGYKYDPLDYPDLGNLDTLKQYDVIFLNCGGGTIAGEHLRSFVGEGGTLYASDLQYGAVAGAFPEHVRGFHQPAAFRGHVKADVVDPGLKDLLGARIDLHFDITGEPATFGGDDVTVFLEAAYPMAPGGFVPNVFGAIPGAPGVDDLLGKKPAARKSGKTKPQRTKPQSGGATVPLLVKFPFKKGSVIFTSFHNSAQNSEMELKLLKYIVFSAVTARMEGAVDEALADKGFKAVRKEVAGASEGEQSPVFTYTSEKVAHLQFVLAFEDRGANLKLKVTGPNGEQFEKEGTSTLTVDVPSAAVGAWKYAVRAIRVPYTNFPMRMTVAEK